MSEVQPDFGVPGLFLDGQDFADAFAQALSKLPVSALPEFHAKLTEALRQSEAGGDSKPFVRLALGLVMDERLSANPEFKQAVKDVEAADAQSPPAPVDHRALVRGLRAG